MPSVKDYENELTLIRIPALDAAKSENNRAAEGNVKRICSGVSKLIERYLAEEPIRTLKTDLDELRKLDDEDKQFLEKARTKDEGG